MNCSLCQQTICRNLTLLEIFCFQPLSVTELCLDCQKSFKRLSSIEGHHCVGCQRPSKQCYCSDCQKWQQQYPTYDFHHEALFSYNDAMKAFFEAYKFQGNYCLRNCFAKPLQAYFKTKKDWLIVPIPVSTTRFAQRGFNQVTGLLAGANQPYQECLLRVKHQRSQVKKNRTERLTTNQPFELPAAHFAQLANQKILLVDDIYTTGRTLFHAAEQVLCAKPQVVQTFSLAR